MKHLLDRVHVKGVSPFAYVQRTPSAIMIFAAASQTRGRMIVLQHPHHRDRRFDREFSAVNRSNASALKFTA